MGLKAVAGLLTPAKLAHVCHTGTYEQGSHVLQFGSLAIDDEPVGDYQGEADTGDTLVGPDSTTVLQSTLHHDVNRLASPP